MITASLTSELKHEARRLGFDLVGAAPAVAPKRYEQLRQWIADGFAGEMHYLSDRIDAYEHPNRLLDGARSLLVVGLNYRTVEPIEPGPGQARVSRCAWGLDYHEVVRERLHALVDFHQQQSPSARTRAAVDTAPLLERYFGWLAGLGWIGKNTMLIHPRLGSWFFLGALLTTEELDYDAPIPVGGCGACRACLDACQAGALAEPYRLDARRCVSYLTIELRGQASAEDRSKCGNRIYGCDACQQACPWNRATPRTSDPAFAPRPGMNPVDLAELRALDEEGFRTKFRHSPLWRVRDGGVWRNGG
jgi:epoxyqueuosine reductase